MIKLSLQLSVRLIGKHKREKNTSNQTKNEEKFIQLAGKAIQTLSKVRAKSTIDNYWTALRSMTEFGGTDLSVQQIDTHLLEGYQQWLLSHSISLNTISCYMRSLRALIHTVSPTTDIRSLFSTVFTGKQRTEKRSITRHEANELRLLRLPPHSRQAFWRDIFMFSFYALGMPFVDIAFLRKSQITNGYIVYNRHKTGQRIRVKIEPLMQQIIDRYQPKDSSFVFPILDDRNQAQLFRQYENARSCYNRHLKKLGGKSGLQHVLTSYVARHSWASMAYESNIELSVISKALGHTSPNTTLTYIREIDDARIDLANSFLMSKIMSENEE